MNDNKKRGLMLLLVLVVIIAAEILIGMHFVNKWTAEAENAAPDSSASSAYASEMLLR